MRKTINWNKFEASIYSSITRHEYLLARSKAIYGVDRDILRHKSEKAYNAFKTFLKQLDKENILDSQKLGMIKDFKVVDHL